MDSSGAKIKIENLHYDLTEEDIRVRLFDYFYQFSDSH